MSPERLRGTIIVLVALVALVGAMVYGYGRNSDGGLNAVDILRKGTGRGALAGVIIKAYDLNGNGGISKEEFPGTPARFVKFDLDSDGQLVISELKSSQGRKTDARPGRGFVKKYDSNDDKRLSAKEFPGQDAAFEALDVDDDGLLVALEVAFRAKGFDDGSEKGKKGKKGKRGKRGKKEDKGQEAPTATDEEPGASEAVAEDNEGGVSDKVGRKNRAPRDTLDFHGTAQADDAPEETAAVEDAGSPSGE